jgi:hypothetical protein
MFVAQFEKYFLQGQKEPKKAINSELKKLQFLGAGPKMAVPDVDAFSKFFTRFHLFQ